MLLLDVAGHLVQQGHRFARILEAAGRVERTAIVGRHLEPADAVERRAGGDHELVEEVACPRCRSRPADHDASTSAAFFARSVPDARAVETISSTNWSAVSTRVSSLPFLMSSKVIFAGALLSMRMPRCARSIPWAAAEAGEDRRIQHHWVDRRPRHVIGVLCPTVGGSIAFGSAS